MNAMVQIETTELRAWSISPGALLLVGRVFHPMPLAGFAQLERRQTDRGSFRALAWGLDHATNGTAFVAAVRLPPATTIGGGQSLALEDPRGERVVLHLPAELTGARDFALSAAQWAEHDKATGARLGRFLLEMFPQAVMRRLPAIGNMVATLFAGLAVDDGCIELMGAIPDVCGFLQGWGGPVAPEAHNPDGGIEALLVGDRVVRARLRAATFARPDIVLPATGVVLVVDDQACSASDAAALPALPGLERVYLVTEGAVLRRAVVERRLLNPLDSASHLRDLLPALTADPSAADCLRRALRPRYEGRETLGEQPLPVRAALDHALLLPPESGALPAGVYLSGWLFDPTGAVAEVILRDHAGFAVRLDLDWTRIERADVTAALTREGFPPPAHDAHGFAVYVEHNQAPGAGLHIDLSFRDGTCAFLPVVTVSARDVAARGRVLEGTDLHKPSGLAVVERQLGPLFLALMRRPAAYRSGNASPPESPAVALVVPLVGPPALPRSFLSQFLHDPLANDEALVLVCGPAWGAASVATLRRTAHFMGLPARVITAADASDATAALDIAAEAVPALRYLLLDPATAGTRPGWRRALRAAAEAAPASAVICPTLIYEDASIRYAGAQALITHTDAPYVGVARHLAGMPASLLEDGPPQATVFGTLACCLVPRTVLSAIGGARTRLATSFGQETAFFLRLRAAGIVCLWVERAQVFAVDVNGLSSPSTHVGRLVDGWCLRTAQERELFAAKPISAGGV